MLKLYSKCFQLNNIKRAIKTVLSHSGSKTSGPNKINRQSNISEERFIREIKLRLSSMFIKSSIRFWNKT